MDPRPPRRTTHVTNNPRNMLVYDRWGQFGRPVLLLHGVLFDRSMWWPVAAELGDRCTVIAPDLPGHGQSPPRDSCTPEQVAADLAGLVLSLDLHRAPVVVGHGTSARLATTFAESYATHHVITLDEPDSPAASLDEAVAAARLDEIPEMYRPYAEPRRDPDLLRVYEGWLGPPPARHPMPAHLLTAPGRPLPEPTAFAPLTDPADFAASLNALL